MISIVMAILIPAAIVAAMIVLVVRRGLEMKQLLADGVPTTALVRKKILQRTRGKHAHKRRRIRYAYRDAEGRTHEYVSNMSIAQWSALEEGGPIDVVYSRSRPHISAPRFLVDAARGK